MQMVSFVKSFHSFLMKMLIFMSSEYSFIENYGILFCGSDEIFDNEPYKIEYNPNFQVNGSGANE